MHDVTPAFALLVYFCILAGQDYFLWFDNSISKRGLWRPGAFNRPI